MVIVTNCHQGHLLLSSLLGAWKTDNHILKEWCVNEEQIGLD